jgi:hypothetical protein
LKTRVGSPGSTNMAAIITGRTLRAATSSSHGIDEVMPLVSMKTPRPASPRAPVRAKSSSGPASREGIGVPFSPLCCSRVEVAKPIAPARTASRTMRRISAISAAVAARFVASAPSTYVRTDEWPTNEPTLGTTPRRSMAVRNSG